MAKVLISPLGSGRYYKEGNKRTYSSATYKFEESNKKYETTFVTAVLAEHLEVDKILLVGTAKSMWDEVYNYYIQHSYNAVDEDYWLELADKLENSSYDDLKIKEKDLNLVEKAMDLFLQQVNSNSQGGSKAILIDYGICEEELWNNYVRGE